MSNKFFRISTVVLATIILILITLIVLQPKHDCLDYIKSRDEIVDNTTSNNDNTSGIITNISTSTDEANDHSYCYEYLDTAMAHTEWVDEVKFFNSYVLYLKDALNASDNKELNVDEFRKLRVVYACVSECMLTKNDTLYDDVVYQSWLNITYLANIDNDCNENSFTNEYRKVIVEEIEILESFEKKPTVFPFEKHW